jgi:hypothetical protein
MEWNFSVMLMAAGPSLKKSMGLRTRFARGAVRGAAAIEERFLALLGMTDKAGAMAHGIEVMADRRLAGSCEVAGWQNKHARSDEVRLVRLA